MQGLSGLSVACLHGKVLGCEAQEGSGQHRGASCLGPQDCSHSLLAQVLDRQQFELWGSCMLMTCTCLRQPAGFRLKPKKNVVFRRGRRKVARDTVPAWCQSCLCPRDSSHRISAPVLRALSKALSWGAATCITHHQHANALHLPKAVCWSQTHDSLMPLGGQGGTDPEHSTPC